MPWFKKAWRLWGSRKWGRGRESRQRQWVRVEWGEDERRKERQSLSIICDGWAKHSVRGLAEGECSVTASEGELWGCSTELGGSTFTGSLHWELSHYQLYTENRDSLAESFSTPSAYWLFCSLSRSHELSASASLGQHVHLQPAQWLHDRPPEAWPTSASSTCLSHPCQVSYNRAHTSSHFPCTREETSASSDHRSRLLQLHHQRCQADSCLSRASGADPSHDT